MNTILDGLLKAFELIFSLDKEILQITFLSLQVSGAATLIGSMVGIPIGAFLSFKTFLGKSLAITLNSTLMGLPPVVVGLFVYLLLSMSGPLGFLGLLFTPTAMIIAQTIMVVPIVAGITLAALNSVGKPIREKAISLGATQSQLVFTTLKEARFGILMAIITGFGAAISEVGAIIMVGGNIRWHTRTLTTATLLETRQGDFGLAIALGTILLILAFLVNFLLNKAQGAGK